MMAQREKIPQIPTRWSNAAGISHTEHSGEHGRSLTRLELEAEILEAEPEPEPPPAPVPPPGPGSFYRRLAGQIPWR